VDSSKNSRNHTHTYTANVESISVYIGIVRMPLSFVKVVVNYLIIIK
jgi:hypothetical protein